MNKKIFFLNLIGIFLISTGCGKSTPVSSSLTSNTSSVSQTSLSSKTSSKSTSTSTSTSTVYGSLKVDTKNFKKIYEVNEDIDLTNLVVTYLESGKVVKTLSSNEYIVDGFDSSKPGYSYIRVCYNNLVASIQTTIKGYSYNFLNDKYCYYFDESFSKDDFKLYKYDEKGETEISDYQVDLPTLENPGVTDLTITYSDFTFKEKIYRVQRPQINPLVFHEEYENEVLILYVHAIKTTFVPSGEKVTKSEGVYALQSNGRIHLFNLKYTCDEKYKSYFDSEIAHKIQSDGDLEVTIGDHSYIAHETQWHHLVIGW